MPQPNESNSVVCEITRTKRSRRYADLVEHKASEFAGWLIVRNHPNHDKLQTGLPLPQCVAIRDGTTTFGRTNVEVFDCGLPNTPENRKLLKPKR